MDLAVCSKVCSNYADKSDITTTEAWAMKVIELISILQHEFSPNDEVSMTVMGKGGISVDEIFGVYENGGPSLLSYEAHDSIMRPDKKRRVKRKSRATKKRS